jgi:hypothetical protein
VRIFFLNLKSQIANKKDPHPNPSGGLPKGEGARILPARIVSAFADADPLTLARRATFVLFLIGPNLYGQDWHYRLVFQVLAVIGLVSASAGRSVALWCVITLLMFLKTLDHWWMQDNHVFLQTWWCFAMTIGVIAREPQRIVPLNARVLIGLSFFLAVLWKGFLSPDYVSGDYFHYTFLTDARFGPMGTLLCKMSGADFRHNYDAVARVASYTPPEVREVQLKGTPSLRTLAIVVTWWTLFIEGALALLFLVPRSWRIARCRDAALLLFAWTTYLAAPVKTFGWTLLTMGIAQTDREARVTRMLYLITLPLLLIYEQAPIWAWINALARRWAG